MRKAVNRVIPIRALEYAVDPQDLLVSTLNAMRLELGVGDNHDTVIRNYDEGELLWISIWTWVTPDES